MVKKILFLLFSLLIISGCQVADLQEAPIQVSETPPADLINTVQPIDENQASEVESPEVTPDTSDESETMSELEKHPQVIKAKDDLATQINAPLDQIEIVKVRSMTWPDSSMGCPQPGMAYLQVQKEGLLIQLRAGGLVYNYHSGGNLDPFLCVQKSGSKEPPIKLDLSMARTPLPDDLDK